MKKCCRCLQIKEYSEFYKDKTHKDGLYSFCKHCKYLETKTRRLNNPEEAKRINRESAGKWRAKNPEKSVRLALEYRKNHYKEFEAYRKKKGLEDKMGALNNYSNNNPCCNCCGEREIMFLSIDHKNNDGYKDRKITGNGTGFYRWLRLNKYPMDKGYQVLCYNCNRGKVINRGLCPHRI